MISSTQDSSQCTTLLKFFWITYAIVSCYITNFILQVHIFVAIKVFVVATRSKFKKVRLVGNVEFFWIFLRELELIQDDEVSEKGSNQL